MEYASETAMKDYQQQLFPYAYNILGSAEDARDAVQDVISRYISLPRQDIENEAGYLVRSVINQSINLKNRQKKSVGERTWLPEPVATESADTALYRDEILSYSLLVLLEHLKPRERAVFILKEAFDYSHEEIAHTLSISIDNSRQLLRRARNELKNHRDQIPIKAVQVAGGYLENYLAVIRNGEIKALERLLSEEITTTTDGGGTIKVASEFEAGIPAVSLLMLYVYRNFQKTLRAEMVEMNHQPALLFWQENACIACQIFEPDPQGRIRNIYSVVDPLKVKNL